MDGLGIFEWDRGGQIWFYLYIIYIYIKLKSNKSKPTDTKTKQWLSEGKGVGGMSEMGKGSQLYSDGQ